MTSSAISKAIPITRSTGRDLRQGRGGHHAAVFACPALATRCCATVQRGSGEFKRDRLGRGLVDRHRVAVGRSARATRALAFFTGRDQSQALTGWWAQQFGTPNYAAHGGFCSVNMAAAGLYTIGGSFWEFGEPDWEHTRYLMMFGVAEDHDSNPIKIGLGKLKAPRRQDRLGQSGQNRLFRDRRRMDRHRPGTDGLFVLAARP